MYRCVTKIYKQVPVPVNQLIPSKMFESRFNF